MSDQKHLNVRISGNTDFHVREAAKVMGVSIRMILKKKSGNGYYAYGFTSGKIPTSPEREKSDGDA